jgi:TatD DNase family protein
MFFVDTHAHLYLKEFDNDRSDVVRQAVENNVTTILLPNIDSESIEPMRRLCEQFPEHCLPTAGLHPTSVNKNYRDEMAIVEHELKTQKCHAVGETGIDLYWDSAFFKEQEYCFNRQLELALQYDLPVIIHSRNALNEIFDMLKSFGKRLPSGVFHCFPGDVAAAEKVIELGFYLGIGGVVTFKKSNQNEIIKSIPLQYIVLETDAPYLAPVPFRGKRNESAYIPIIAEYIASQIDISLEDVAEITTRNVKQLFRLNLSSVVVEK